MQLKAIKLITGELIFGEVESVQVTETYSEILLKSPFQAVAATSFMPQGYMPYCSDSMSTAPAAIQINPMNIVWTAPLEDFPQAFETYQDAVFKIQKPESSIIV